MGLRAGKGMLAACLVVLASGCAGTPETNRVQGYCERNHPYFPMMIECLNRAAADDPAFFSNPAADPARLYLAFGEALARRVEGGTVQEYLARAAYAELYGRLVNEKPTRMEPERAAQLLTGLAVFTPAELPPGSEAQIRYGGPITCGRSGEKIVCR